MTEDPVLNESVIFGPVPSRRLGASLGVNNIPPKKCTYSCLYCQLGRTTELLFERESYYSPVDLVNLACQKVSSLMDSGIALDYITFVADGEPTLDSNLGKEIDLLHTTGIPIAVISNASLIWRDDVRADLCKADWVSLSVNAVTPQIWRGVNRPHGKLELKKILEGIKEFSASFAGRLVTETMLLAGMNDGDDEISKIADFIVEIEPDITYLSIPTRPPAEQVSPPAEQALNAAYQAFSKKLDNVEYLIGYEGDAFAASGDSARDLLSITAVHPMRRDAVERLLISNGQDIQVLKTLLQEGLLKETKYEGTLFYMRDLSRKSRD